MSLINDRDFPEGNISLLRMVSTSKSTYKSSNTDLNAVLERSKIASTIHFLEASRTADKSALAPSTRDKASMTIDLPDPVSPVTTLSCRPKSDWMSSISAKFTIEIDCNQ